MSNDINCVHCDGEFDPVDKIRQAKISRRPAGKFNECIDCASSGPEKYTGVMIYGHKTAGSIQINTDPRLTQYMLKSSPSAGSRLCMGTTLPAESALHVAHHSDRDIAKRR